MTTAWVPLATASVAADASVIFSSIPATYRDLVLVVSGTHSASVIERIYLNGDTTASNYSRIVMYGTGSAAGSVSFTSDFQIANVDSTQANLIVNFMDYSATDKHKTYIVRSNSTSKEVTASANRWANTSAVTSITYTANTGTFTGTISLYGSNKL